MSIRSTVLQSIEDEREAREQSLNLLENATEVTPLALDARFIQNPLKDQKPFWDHMYPKNVASTVAKCAFLESLVVMAQPSKLDVPDDAISFAKWLSGKLWLPVVRDLSIKTFSSIYCRLFPYLISPRDSVFAGRFSRDVRVASNEAFSYAKEINLRDPTKRFSPIFDPIFLSRCQANNHVMLNVLPFPSLVMSASIASVYFCEAIIRWAINYVKYGRDKGAKEEKQVSKKTKDEHVKYDDMSLSQKTKIILSGGSLSFLLQCSLGGFFNFLSMGTGAILGQTIGDFLAWFYVMGM